jgi:hypothetical protein
MPTFFRLIKRVIWTSAAALFSVAACQVFSPAVRVTESAAVAQDLVVSTTPQYQGIDSCVPCHDRPIGARKILNTANREFCGLNEASIFVEDKHGQAYELLKGKLGLQMEKILANSKSEPDDKPDYKVTTDKQCLACHANYRRKENFEQPLFEFGVTCESCHGPSSVWETHHKKPSWRKLSAEEKEQKYGMIDVRNPMRRARQCFSCHIGNVQEGKVVTHEMYAAGHPPLPSIEIETFSQQMPTHWRSLNEKGRFKHLADYLEANYPGQGEKPLSDLPRTKSVIIGGTMALRETVNLFASQAVDDDSQAWPELAVFDCSACHHDLASPSWRQTRGYGKSLPGRPQMFAWPEALVKLGIRQRAGMDDAAFKQDCEVYESKMEELRRVLDRRPFGDPKAIQKVAMGDDGLIAWLDQLASDVFQSPVGKEEASRTLQTLVSLPLESYPDFHSARQLVWAIRTVQTEISVDLPVFDPGTEEEFGKKSISRALKNFKVYQNWKDGDRAEAEEKVDELLKQLELIERLRLDLPAGAGEEDPEADQPPDALITNQLPEALKAINGYDPEWFRKQLQELEKSLDVSGD